MLVTTWPNPVESVYYFGQLDLVFIFQSSQGFGHSQGIFLILGFPFHYMSKILLRISKLFYFLFILHCSFIIFFSPGPNRYAESELSEFTPSEMGMLNEDYCRDWIETLPT